METKVGVSGAYMEVVTLENNPIATSLHTEQEQSVTNGNKLFYGGILILGPFMTSSDSLEVIMVFFVCVFCFFALEECRGKEALHSLLTSKMPYMHIGGTQ